MTNCSVCKDVIILHQEPKLKFTKLGGDFIHSKCYFHVHETSNIWNFVK